MASSVRDTLNLKPDITKKATLTRKKTFKGDKQCAENTSDSSRPWTEEDPSEQAYRRQRFAEQYQKFLEVLKVQPERHTQCQLRQERFNARFRKEEEDKLELEKLRQENRDELHSHSVEFMNPAKREHSIKALQEMERKRNEEEMKDMTERKQRPSGKGQTMPPSSGKLVTGTQPITTTETCVRAPEQQHPQRKDCNSQDSQSGLVNSAWVRPPKIKLDSGVNQPLSSAAEAADMQQGLANSLQTLKTDEKRRQFKRKMVTDSCGKNSITVTGVDCFEDVQESCTNTSHMAWDFAKSEIYEQDTGKSRLSPGVTLHAASVSGMKVRTIGLEVCDINSSVQKTKEVASQKQYSERTFVEPSEQMYMWAYDQQSSNKPKEPALWEFPQVPCLRVPLSQANSLSATTRLQTAEAARTTDRSALAQAEMDRICQAIYATKLQAPKDYSMADRNTLSEAGCTFARGNETCQGIYATRLQAREDCNIANRAEVNEKELLLPINIRADHLLCPDSVTKYNSTSESHQGKPGQARKQPLLITVDSGSFKNMASRMAVPPQFPETQPISLNKHQRQNLEQTQTVVEQKLEEKSISESSLFTTLAGGSDPFVADPVQRVLYLQQQQMALQTQLDQLLLQQHLYLQQQTGLHFPDISSSFVPRPASDCVAQAESSQTSEKKTDGSSSHQGTVEQMSSFAYSENPRKRNDLYPWSVCRISGTLDQTNRVQSELFSDDSHTQRNQIVERLPAELKPAKIVAIRQIVGCEEKVDLLTDEEAKERAQRILQEFGRRLPAASIRGQVSECSQGDPSVQRQDSHLINLWQR